MKCLFPLVLSMFAVAAQADLELSGVAAGRSSPGAAELVATVSGTGDVFAAYAPLVRRLRDVVGRGSVPV